MFNSDLAPVQLLFLKSPKKMTIDEAIGIILRDLTLRRVLSVERVNSYPNDRSRKTQKYFRISSGPNFENYEPSIFEKSFCSPFKEINLLQAKTLTNFVLRNYGTPSGFIGDRIYKPLNEEKYISSLPFLKTFGYYNVSNKAKEIVEQLNTFIVEQEEKLTNLIDGDKGQFIEAIKETGVYTFYFEKNNPALYKDIISMVKRINISIPMGMENDLSEFVDAINIDLSYFLEH